jgi:hypothetical protein
VIERGSRELLTGCRWVILAVGSKPCRSLEATARALGIDARVVGDAAEPRQAVEAIAEGFEAGRRLG